MDLEGDQRGSRGLTVMMLRLALSRRNEASLWVGRRAVER